MYWEGVIVKKALHSFNLDTYKLIYLTTIIFVLLILIINYSLRDFRSTPVAFPPLPMSRHRAIRNIDLDGNSLIDPLLTSFRLSR